MIVEAVSSSLRRKSVTPSTVAGNADGEPVRRAPAHYVTHSTSRRLEQQSESHYFGFIDQVNPVSLRRVPTLRQGAAEHDRRQQDLDLAAFC